MLTSQHRGRWDDNRKETSGLYRRPGYRLRHRSSSPYGNNQPVGTGGTIPGSRLAKSVVVHHELGYVLAVVPSTHRIELSTLQDVVDRRLGLASEEEVTSLFADCDIGAVPPIGSAYDVPVILDESLGDTNDVYFEGGDHKTLVHVSGPNFRSLMKDARVARFSYQS